MENILFVIIIFVFIQRKMGFWPCWLCVSRVIIIKLLLFRTCIENVISLSLSYLIYFIYFFVGCCCQHFIFYSDWGVMMICLDYKWMIGSYAAEFIGIYKSQVLLRWILYCKTFLHFSTFWKAFIKFL